MIEKNIKVLDNFIRSWTLTETKKERKLLLKSLIENLTINSTQFNKYNIGRLLKKNTNYDTYISVDGMNFFKRYNSKFNKKQVKSGGYNSTSTSLKLLDGVSELESESDSINCLFSDFKKGLGLNLENADKLLSVYPKKSRTFNLKARLRSNRKIKSNCGESKSKKINKSKKLLEKYRYDNKIPILETKDADLFSLIYDTIKIIKQNGLRVKLKDDPNYKSLMNYISADNRRSITNKLTGVIRKRSHRGGGGNNMVFTSDLNELIIQRILYNYIIYKSKKSLENNDRLMSIKTNNIVDIRDAFIYNNRLYTKIHNANNAINANNANNYMRSIVLDTDLTKIKQFLDKLNDLCYKLVELRDAPLHYRHFNCKLEHIYLTKGLRNNYNLVLGDLDYSRVQIKPELLQTIFDLRSSSSNLSESESEYNPTVNSNNVSNSN